MLFKVIDLAEKLEGPLVPGVVSKLKAAAALLKNIPGSEEILGLDDKTAKKKEKPKKVEPAVVIKKKQKNVEVDPIT